MEHDSRKHQIVTRVATELVIYDQLRHVMHRLNQTAASVWQEAEHSLEVGEIATRLQLPHDTVVDALHRLAAAKLLSTSALPATQSRRNLLRKAGIAGVVAPVVISLTAPMAAAQGSVCSTPPQPHISIWFEDEGDNWVVYFSASGYCPNTTYPASRYTRRMDASFGPYDLRFITDSSGVSPVDTFGAFSKGGGYEVRIDEVSYSTGWVTVPS